MKILIIGGTGQLGKTLYRLFEQQKSALGVLPVCFIDAEVYATGININRFDIADADSVFSFFKETAFDLIINTAAMTQVDDCEAEPEKAMRINALGARNLAHASRKINARIAHISTDYVFSGETDKPYVEWDEPNPMTVYGKSKLLGERYVAEVNPRVYIIRTAWLYSKGNKNFVNAILNNAREKSRVQVVNDQFGNPTYVEDLAYQILLITATEYYGIYHCTGNGVCTWFDFAREIVRLAQIDCEVVPCTTDEYKRAAPRPCYSALDHVMLRGTVGDHMRHWMDALREGYFA